MLPWRSWHGEIPDDEDIFRGEWQDPLGSHGTFRGEATIGTPDEVVFIGTWTAIYDDPSGLSVIIEMGTFHMTFRYASRECSGQWWTYDSDIFRGTMRGHKVN